MTVTNVEKDAENLTMTLTTELDAGVDRVWQMWENPRLLEKWWGPPTYPATFEQHDFEPGGTVGYYMTGPEGDKHAGYWKMRTVEPPSLIELVDGFADGDKNMDDGMPVMEMRVEITPIDGAEGQTRMTITTTFPSAVEMKQMLEMGMDEGMSLAVGQIDDLL